MNTVPMPMPSRNSAGKITVQYRVDSAEICVSSSIPHAASSAPGTSRYLGGTRVISRAAICVDPTSMPPTIGRNATPALSGE